MVQQYPHFINVTIVTPPTQNTTTGQWTVGSTSYLTLDCRAEVNGAGKKIAGNDGVLMDFAFTCYFPKMNTVIPVDSEYVLSMDNATAEGKVKRQSNGQLNSRLWL